MSLKQNQLHRWSKWARQILTTRHASLVETLSQPRRARDRGLDFDVERLEVREMLSGQPLETITSDQLLPDSENLIVNGSFEQGDIRRGVHRYADASIPAWVTSSSSDRRKFAMEIAKNSSASDRTAYLQLEYRQGRIDSVYQDVQTTAGTDYLLTFDLRERCSRRGSVMVMWGGEVVAILDASRVWEKQTLRVTANSTGTTRLEFAIVGGAPTVGPTGENVPNNTGRFNSTAQIDDVRLYEIGDDILVNGSFEEGPRRSGKHHPDAIPGWDVIEDKKPFITTRRFARSSEQWFYLDMGTRRVATDGVRQTVATVPNTEYALFLDVAGICHRNGTVNVYWDGELVAAITPADRYWTNYALKVTANGTGQSVLELVVDTPNKKLGRRIKIDDIALHGLRPSTEPVAPQLAPLENATVAEGTQLQIQASATDPDSTQSQLTYAFQSATPAGVVIDSRTGLITWTPGESQGPSSYDLVVLVTDQTGLSDTTPLTITVTEANRAPVLAPINDRTINEEDTLSFFASATDDDLPANRLVFSLGAGAPSGAAIHALSGQFSWTPTELEGPGDYEFTVIVTDEAGAADQQSFTVQVNEVNQAPVLAPIDDRTINELDTLSFFVSATDNDLPPSDLVFSLAPGAPAGATIDATTGQFSWTPTEAEGPGDYEFTVIVTDESAASDQRTFAVHVNELSGAPQLGVIDDRTINELDTLTFIATAINTDGSTDGLVFSLAPGAPAGAAIDAVTGQFSWTPTEAEGPGDYELTVIVTDDAGVTDQQSFSVHVNEVNQAPVLAPIDDRTISELDTLSFFVSASDNDLPPGSLVYSLASGAPAGATIDATTGEFSWTTTEAEGPGDYEFTVIVADSSGASDQRTFNVHVNEVNQAPELAPINNVTIGLDETLSVTAQATDADLPASALIYTLDNAPAGAQINPQTGAITWTGTEIGTYEFLVRVADSGGLFDTTTFQVTVSDEDCLFDHDAWLFSETGGSTTAAGSGQTVDCSIVLEEGDSFTVEAAVSFTVEATTQQFVFSYEALLFDLQSTGTVHDAVEVALLDSNGNSLVHTIGEGNDAFFNVTEGEFVALGANSLVDGTIVSLDLSHIAVGTTATLVFRLVNNDTDTQTTVRFNPLQFLATGLGTPVGAARAAAQAAGAIEDLASLVDVTPSVSVHYGQTSWNEADGVLFADVELTNEANYPIDGPYVLVVDQLSSPQVAVLGASGVTDEGARYYVLSDATADGALALGESTLTQRLQFFNPTGEPFTYRLTLLAQPNQAPSFTTEGLGEGLVGVTYAYDADAVDPDGDTVSYRLLAGPAGLSVDAATGQVHWMPTAADVGTHSVILEASDGRGGITTQQYALEVKTSVPNRPPVILSTPVVQTYLSGQSLFSNSTDPGADDPLTRFIELTPADVGSASTSRFSTLPSLDPALFGLDYENIQIVNFDVDPLGNPIANGAFITTQYESLNLVMNNFQVSATVYGGPASAPNATYTPRVPGEALVFDFVVPLRAVGFINTSPDQDRIEFLDSDGNVILSTRDQDNRPGPNFNIDRFLGYIADPERPIASLRVRNNTGNLELDELIFVPVETTYQYDVDAVDADGDTIRYQLDESPAGMTINSSTGLISWNPTADQLGTHTVRVIADDGRGGTATQEYEVQVLPDSTNSAPQIVSDPVETFFIPGFSNPASGNVAPQRVALDLGNGEIFEGTVSITLPDSAARFADIVLAVDESGSMTGDQAWVAEMIPLLDAALIAEGIGADPATPNRFAVVGFGGGRENILVGHFINQQRPTKYKLYGPNNQLVTEGILTDVVPDELLNAELAQDGRYVLVIEAANRDDLATGVDIGVQGALGEATRTEPFDLNTVVEGVLALPGQAVAYEFSLSAPTLLHFDAQANDIRVRWTLEGPSGVVVNQREFAPFSSAAFLGAIGEVPAGNYTLTIDAARDEVADYKFQLLDLSIAPLIVSGQQISDQFVNKNETFAYRFQANADEVLQFVNSTTGVNPHSKWRIVDSHGDIIAEQDIGVNAPNVRLPRTGEYYLLMESFFAPTEGSLQVRVDSEFTFELTIHPPVPAVAVAPGDTMHGAIDFASEIVEYGFTVGQRSLYYFDALEGDLAKWTLVGPAGTVVANRNFSQSDSFGQSNPILELAAGDYRLQVTASGINDFSFRLLNLSEATPIAYDTSFSGELGVATQSHAYQWTANAGDRIYVSIESASATGSALYRIVDPFGQIVSEQRSLTDEDAFELPRSGVYTLLVEGSFENGDVDTYTMNVRSVPVRHETLTLGTAVAGELTQPGDTVTYRLTLDDYALIYMDSLTDNSAINWTLVGPRGTEVSRRAFSASDSVNYTNPIAELVPGKYELTVDGNGATVGQYGFVLFDLLDASQGTQVTPAPGAANPLVSIVGSNDVPNGTQLYYFTAEAGDEFSFDGSATGTNIPFYRLISPKRQQLFAPTAMTSDRLNQRLVVGGEYVLLIEGRVNDTSVDNYQLDLQFVQNHGPLSYAGTALPWGEIVDGDLAVAGQVDQYTFTLTQRTNFYLDALTNSNAFRWDLLGPSGETLVSNRSFTSTDSFDINNPVLNLLPGDYQIQIDASSGTPGSYQFRALSLAEAIPITPGTAFSGELTPANGTDMYRFDATAGEKFYVDIVAASDLTNTEYKLINEFGQVEFTSNRMNDASVYEVRTTGTYTVLVEGGRGNTGNDSYTMNVVPVIDTSAVPMSLNAITNGSILAPGQTDRYAFTLTDDSRLSFDSLTQASNLTWSLVGPAGNVVSAKRFDQSDFGINGTVISAYAGDYELSVTATGDALVDYGFQVLDLSAAVPLVLGATASETRTLNSVTTAYQFEAESGDRVLFRNVSLSGFASTPGWRLVDQFGRDVFRQAATAQQLHTLNATGTYTLLLEGAASDSGAGGEIHFVVDKLDNVNSPAAATALNLGDSIAGELALPFEMDRYTFTLDEPSLIYVDSLTNRSTLTWTLSDAARAYRTSVRFDQSDASGNASPVLALRAGEYTFEVTSSVAEPYGFRVINLADASDISFGTSLIGDLDPVNETHAYHLTGDLGDRIYLDIVSVTNSTAARIKLINRFGQTLLNQVNLSDVSDVVLPETGDYWLLIEGNINATAGASYELNVVKQTTLHEVLQLNAVTTGTLSGPGDRAIYEFDLTDSTELYFDSLANRSDINWSLQGPAGPIVSNQGFHRTDWGQIQTSLGEFRPGSYTLTVDGTGAVVGEFAFRLLDLDGVAHNIGYEETLTGRFDLRQTDVFQFEGIAGEQLLIDVVSTTSASAGIIIVVDPLGNLVASTTTIADLELAPLSATGTYDVLFVGRIDATVAQDYEFRLERIDTPATAYNVGDVIDTNIDHAGDQRAFTFTLSDDTLLYFDAMQNSSSALWSLQGPTGVMVSGRRFTQSDSAEFAQPVLEARAGNYTLTIDGAGDFTGAIRFRVLDLMTATPMTPGTSVTGTLATGVETQMFQFEAQAGDRYMIDSIAASGSAYYKLIDPFGRAVVSSIFSADRSGIETVAGKYTLLIEGRITATSAATYELNVVLEGNTPPSPITGVTLDFATTQSGNLAVAAQVDSYQFTLTERSLIYFDSLTNSSSILWDLRGPRGSEVTARRMDRSDAVDFAAPVLDLVAGTYQLDVYGASGTPGEYNFRVLNLAAGIDITRGVPFTGELTLGAETEIYHFDASTGEQLYIDVTDTSDLSNGLFRIVDPFGRIVATSNRMRDIADLTISVGGTYTLMVEGVRGNVGLDSYTISVNTMEVTETPLVLNAFNAGTIALAGAQLGYTFEVTEDVLLYFAPITNSQATNWSIQNEKGTHVPVRRFFDGVQFESLEAGQYTLLVDGTNDFVGGVEFIAYVVSAASVLSVDDVTTATLDAGNAVQIYQFDAAAGQQFALTPDLRLQFGDSTSAADAATRFAAFSDPEDGYSGIAAALRSDVFRPGAAVNYILVTDEDRDNLEDNLTFASIFEGLAAQNALLNVVVSASFRDENNVNVIGVDSNGNAYAADGSGGFTVQDGGFVFSTDVSTRQDYIDLAWALDGAAWNVGMLRAGGVTAESFTNAFLDIKVAEIIEQTSLRLTASDPRAHLELLDPVDGVYGTVVGGQTYEFDIRISSDGQPASYDLLFRQGSTTGSIPVYITSPYRYGAVAVDADGDVLTWSIVDGPAGLTIDHSTGALSWTAAGVTYGDHPVTIRVDDGRGGVDEQTYVLHVSGGEPGAIRGTTFHDFDGDGAQQATASLVVPGTSNPYLSGMPDGSTASSGDVAPDHSPPEVVGLPLQAGNILNFFASGSVGFGGAPSPTGTPDGYGGIGSHRAGAQNGISNATYPWNALVGVFLGPEAPNTSTAPAMLDFIDGIGVEGGLNYVQLQPELKQLFFIGDGVTEDGAIQNIIVPEGATRLFLGTSDGFGWYNNQGEFDVVVTETGRGGAGATLVGDSVKISHRSPDLDTVLGDEVSVVVTRGTTDRVEVDPLGTGSDPGYTVNVEDDTIVIEFVADVTFANSVAFHGVLIDDIDWPAAAAATLAKVWFSTNVEGFEGSRLGFGERNVTLDWHGKTMVAGSRFEINLLPTNPGLAGWTIYLDQNRNGILDDGETRTTTDGQGNYEFSDLAPGAYVVREQLQLGWQQTAPSLGSYEVQVDPTAMVDRVDFGNREVSLENSDPRFTNEPATTVIAGERFSYNPTLEELDGDTLTFDLPLAPAGAQVNTQTGAIRWTPSANQIGTHNLMLRVRDGRGGHALQFFTVNVLAPNSAPDIVTTPPVGPAAVNLPYQYKVRANDADLDVVTYRLTSAPDGMTINSETGVVNWTPTGDQLGVHAITIRAEDGRGASSTQAFDLTVELAPANDAPVIRSTAPVNAHLGSNYLYRLDAFDPNGDPMTITLDAAPAGMTVDNDGLIEWEPGPAQLGSHLVRIIVSDGRGGATEQEYTVTVGTQPVNRPPQITSRPSTSVIAGSSYDVTIVAEDADHDTVIFSLEAGPVGMTIDAITGDMHWVPTLSDLGEHVVTIQAIDSSGAYSQLSYVLRVRALNTPPVIVTSPLTEGAIGRTYLYQVGAEDADEDRLTFTLQEAPEGMTIDANTGRIQWTPGAGQDGAHAVTVVVRDVFGGSASQRYTMVVADGQPNRLPVITSTPGFFTSVGDTYNYDVDATDPDGDEILYSLLDAPVGMTIDDATGMISWAPQTGDLGTRIVEVVARDPAGGGSIQQFSLTVLEANDAPVITSTPPSSIAAGATFRYDVLATDPNGDFLTYELASGPAGMVIDGLGRMFWVAGTGMSGTQDVSVIVRDARGAAVNHDFTLNVAADTTAPQVAILLSNNPVNVGSTVEIRVSAVDNVGVTNLRLDLDGVAVGLDASGRARVALNTVGAVTAIATATDAAGNVSTDTIEIFVADPNDVNGPVVVIASPANEGVVTSVTDVIGTVQDDSLVSYRLLLADFQTREFSVIATGDANIDNDVLGTIDTTLLQNGTYVLRLEAIDASGNQNVIEQTISIEQQLKLGDFKLGFTDLTLAVNGIDVIINRSYDSLQSMRDGEVGYGWNLDFRDVKLQTSVVEALESDKRLGFYTPFRDGTKVYLTLPNGKRETFTFTPTAKGLPGLTYYQPKFTAARGTTSTLTVQNNNLSNIDGEYHGFLGGLPYNPAAIEYGGYYILTTQAGVSYRINAETGLIDSATDANGNQVRYSANRIESSDGVAVTFERNSAGKVTAVVAADGKRVEYTYSTDGDLVATRDPNGNETRYVYSESRSHYLEEVLDPLGNRAVRAEYDDAGRLVRITDANGNATSINTDLGANTQRITDALGHQTLLSFDDRGNVIAEIDALGHVTTRSFDTSNNLLSETDPLGRTTTYTYDAFGNELTETDAEGRVTRKTYADPRRGLVATEILPSGAIIRRTYDAKGNILSSQTDDAVPTSYEYDTRGHLMGWETGMMGAFVIESDKTGNVIRQQDELGNEVTFTYDAQRNPLRRSWQQSVNGVLQTLEESWQYDANGNLTRYVDALGGETLHVYNADDRRVSTTDALGRTTYFVYDSAGLLIETIYPDSTPDDLSNNPRTTMAYDALGRVVQRRDELGRITKTVYDAIGRPIEIIHPDSTVNDDADNPRDKYEYDAAGQLVAMVDANGNRTEYEYDLSGNRTVVRDALGGITTISYDADGRHERVVDAVGNVRSYTYDDRGLAKDVIQGGVLIVSMSYNERGLPVQETDANGHSTTFGYDVLGRLISITDAIGSVTRYEYDEVGNRVSTTDANGNRTVFLYDGLNREVSLVRPSGAADAKVYDAVGNLIRYTDFSGDVHAYTYDERDREVRRSIPGSSDVVFAYYDNNLISTVTDERGTTVFSYDQRDQLLSKTDPDGIAISYTYDTVGNRTSVTGLGGTTEYVYDSLNRLVTVIDSDNDATSYSYDAIGRIVRESYANGVSQVWTYDALNRATSIQTLQDSSLVEETVYTYDHFGNRLSEADSDGRRVEYGYDATNRLVSERHISGSTEVRSITYEYDAVGNRTEKIDSVEGTTVMTYDVDDRLVSSNADGQITTYEYDENGNLIRKVSGGATQRFVWTGDNRLISVDLDGNGTPDIIYQYDAFGNRVSRMEAGSRILWQVDTNRQFSEVVAEYRPGGLLEAAYVYGHRLISQDRGAVKGFYLHDVLGSVRRIVDGAGNELNRYVYDAFGNVLFATESFANVYLFAGQQRDPATGLDYLRARNYDPSTGRFLSTDPFAGLIRSPITLHDYIYANGNPTTFVDPSGEVALLVQTLKAAAITVGIGAAVIIGTLVYVRTYRGVAIDADFMRRVWDKSVDRFFETNSALSPFQLIDGNLADRLLFGGRFVAGMATGGLVANEVGGATIIQYLKGLYVKWFVTLAEGQTGRWTIYTFGQFAKGLGANILAGGAIIELGIALGSIAGGIVDAADEVIDEQNG